MQENKLTWTILECETDIQILPQGEETFHSWDSICMCYPYFTFDEDGKQVTTHNSIAASYLMDMAYHSPIHRIVQRIDC